MIARIGRDPETVARLREEALTRRRMALLKDDLERLIEDRVEQDARIVAAIEAARRGSAA